MTAPNKSVDEHRATATEIQQIASSTDRVIVTDHAKERMLEREVTRRQVNEVLRNGVYSGNPRWDEDKEGWKYRFEGINAGADIHVVAALDEDEAGNSVVVITTWDANE